MIFPIVIRAFIQAATIVIIRFMAMVGDSFVAVMLNNHMYWQVEDIDSQHGADHT